MLNSNREAMIGQELMIRGITFEIIGVLSEKGSQGSFFNPDEQILIPLQTARYRVMGTDRLRDITVQARDLNSMNLDRKSTRLNSSHGYISYAVFCLKKKKNHN